MYFYVASTVRQFPFSLHVVLRFYSVVFSRMPHCDTCVTHLICTGAKPSRTPPTLPLSVPPRPGRSARRPDTPPFDKGPRAPALGALALWRAGRRPRGRRAVRAGTLGPFPSPSARGRPAPSPLNPCGGGGGGGCICGWWWPAAVRAAAARGPEAARLIWRSRRAARRLMAGPRRGRSALHKTGLAPRRFFLYGPYGC